MAGEPSPCRLFGADMVGETEFLALWSPWSVKVTTFLCALSSMLHLPCHGLAHISSATELRDLTSGRPAMKTGGDKSLICVQFARGLFLLQENWCLCCTLVSSVVTAVALDVKVSCAWNFGTRPGKYRAWA